MSRTTTLMVGALLVAIFGLESASAGTIEEVLVTARKRVESVQEVPVAIQAFTAEDIERYKATNLQEITELASQVLAFGQSSGNGGTFFIRGQGTGSLDPGLEASVTVNIDGVQVDRGHIHRQAFFDLAGVQVLKGPQALFFGKSSPAGVIALTSAGPTDEFEASFQGGFEFDADEAYFEAAVSGPLSDQVRARLAYRGSDSDGYLKNTSAPFAHSGGIWPDEPFDFPGAARSRAGGQQSHAARLTLDWTPNDRFGAEFKLLYTDFETDNFATIENISCSGPLPVTATLNGLVGLSQGQVVGAALDPSGDCRMNGRISAGSLPPEVARNYPGADKKDGEPYGEYESVLASANLEWDFDSFTITSVTGYYWYDYTRWDNFDGTSFIQFMGIQLEDQATFSQELRLATELEGDWNFMFGGFYETFERDSDNAGKIFAWGVDPVTGFSNNWAGESTVESDSYSVFGQATWQFAEDWELAFGTRFTRDDRKAQQGNTFVHSTAAVFFPGGFFLPAGQQVRRRQRLLGGDVDVAAGRQHHPLGGLQGGLQGGRLLHQHRAGGERHAAERHIRS
jgi:outer membrane receptor protein involved in Fe transport